MSTTTKRFAFVLTLAASLLGLACTGVAGIDGPPPESVPPALEKTFSPGPLGLRRLLSHQYRESIRVLLGDAAAAKAAAPGDATVSGFEAIGAAQLALSSSADLGIYERSAFAVAQAALADAGARARLVPCTPAGATDADCLTRVVSQFGRRAFRRSLEADELELWTGLAKQAAAAYQSFDRGVEFAIAGILQSPGFLYQVELGREVPDRPTWRELTPHELATRLSFFFTGATPTDALLAAADEGPLGEARVRSLSQELVASPAARVSMERFFDEYLLLRDVPQLAKDPSVFPSFTPALASAMREETQRLIRYFAFEEGGDFRQLLDARFTFANADLARHYGLPVPAASGFSRVELGAGMRGGLFGQASVLSMLGHTNSTSPTRRGKFIRERMLCLSIPEPPANVDTTLPADTGNAKTMREKLALHQSSASCSGCHRLMDDVGFGLENFDGVGRYRELENGVTINATTTAVGLGTFTGPSELGALLRASPDPAECLVRSVFRFGTGHVESVEELTSLALVKDGYAASGYRFPNLLVELAASAAFRYGLRPEGAP